MSDIKKIALLGSTGSIGTQTLDVIEKNPERFKLHSVAALNEVDIVAGQIEKFCPAKAVLCDQTSANILGNVVSIPVKSTMESIIELAEDDEVDIVVNAIAGAAGLLPGLAALKAGKRLASANKECFVMAGHLFNDALKYGGEIVPIDSEHSALLQASLSGKHSEIKRLILTASGGPFFNKEIDFSMVTPEDALNHPNWSMGQRITIDSATMFNKGLEVIEARWLFDIQPEKIDVLVHPQSIIHSIVEFDDNSQIAQLSPPDMRLPIQYALAYPDRIDAIIPQLNLAEIKNLSFFNVPDGKFPALTYAFEALKAGGIAPTVANAADEIAVAKFLRREIRFSDIPVLIGKALDKFKSSNKYPDLNEILEADKETRKCLFEC